MAEFVQTMKDWRRMCKAQDDTICGACSQCPMGDDGESCMAVYEDAFDSVDFAHIGQTVAEWAAEHPEPVYPTWAEWLSAVDVIGINPEKGFILIKPEINHHIPVDIAQKLGIKPKEG